MLVKYSREGFQVPVLLKDEGLMSFTLKLTIFLLSSMTTGIAFNKKVVNFKVTDNSTISERIGIAENVKDVNNLKVKENSLSLSRTGNFPWI